MKRLTDRHTETPSLTAKDEHYWINFYHKLAQLEDAEEDNRLIVLPVKTDRKVYYLHALKCKRILPFVNNGIVKRYRINSPHTYVDIEISSGAIITFRLNEFGKKWFSTKEDAEKAFNELSFS